MFVQEYLYFTLLKKSEYFPPMDILIIHLSHKELLSGYETDSM